MAGTQIPLGRLNQFPSDDAISNDFWLTIDIGQESIQGSNPFLETAFKGLPLRGWNDTRQNVKGHDSLRAFCCPIDGEGGAQVKHHLLSGFLGAVVVLLRGAIAPAVTGVQ